MISFGLEGKRAFVSGAGWMQERAGHGRASARKLAEAGAVVACVDIDEGRAKGVVDEIHADGGTAFPVIADMTVRSEVERAVAEAVTEMGGIDVGVDIIGKATWNRSENISDDDWSFAIHTNLTQVYYLFQTLGRQMISQGSGGSLVALSSVDGIVSSRYHAPYGAAKAGVISLTKTYADELGRHGIRVNCVAPGNVGGGNEDQAEGDWANNGINPLAAPRGTDVGNAVLFLSSDLAARTTGQTLVVDGGALTQSLWGMSGEQLDEFRKF
jgi:NAD(P)-dependent dehydrogenase (short-subunit alcohol dehydrogenase family)